MLDGFVLLFEQFLRNCDILLLFNARYHHLSKITYDPYTVRAKHSIIATFYLSLDF